ncbi:hypothetical protein MMC30_000935 [Trapelia coarctata]|nr:hypothetical protein [Trapelia coarctata]
MELIRDTIVGHALRLASGGKILPYAEDRDPSLWKQYVHTEKTAHMAHHGSAGPEEGDGSGSDSNSPHDSQTAFRTASSHRKDVPRNAIGHRIDQEKGKDTSVVHWYGDNDPENPMNWSRPKKFLVTFEICLLTFSIYVGSAIYTPGVEGVMEQFNVSQVKATLGLTLFVAGYGLGPLIWAPMSEIPQIGRNPVYIGTLVVFVVLQLPVIYAKNFAMLLAFRFLTGFVGSPVLATGGASIGDMYRPQKRAYGIAIWGIAAVCGPVLGPLIGGFAVEAKGWAWAIWELMWLSGFSLILFIFFLPETSSSNILYRRARRLRVLTGNESLKSELEIAAEHMTPKEIAMISLVRPITLNFTEPMVFLLNLYIALIYGLLYIWFESFPIVFTGIYGFSLGLSGVAFVGILACVGAFFIPICLFMFGWTARASIHWIVPIIGSAFFSVGTLLLFNSVLNYLGDAYPEYAASVFAGNDLMRSSFGAGFPLFAGAMYNNLGVPWASSTLAFLSIAFIPIPFVLYKFGERLRKMSKHARKDF